MAKPVITVGSGLAGLSAAYEALKAGAKVHMLERAPKPKPKPTPTPPHRQTRVRTTLFVASSLQNPEHHLVSERERDHILGSEYHHR
ncbi:hypothetical protein ONZ43_g2025 [Nemania bipapillata]|uniref:Uncharacterized protein n=1 Tax=Nemania bipapillata TaxID=110536 RepID=A0ACC2J292_9PEZI|nr:hypothetical protein ONZ43_g2025 [Nemania bipapillata]